MTEVGRIRHVKLLFRLILLVDCKGLAGEAGDRDGVAVALTVVVHVGRVCRHAERHGIARVVCGLEVRIFVEVERLVTDGNADRDERSLLSLNCDLLLFFLFGRIVGIIRAACSKRCYLVFPLQRRAARMLVLCHSLVCLILPACDIAAVGSLRRRIGLFQRALEEVAVIAHREARIVLGQTVDADGRVAVLPDLVRIVPDGFRRVLIRRSAVRRLGIGCIECKRVAPDLVGVGGRPGAHAVRLARQVFGQIEHVALLRVRGRVFGRNVHNVRSLVVLQALLQLLEVLRRIRDVVDLGADRSLRTVFVLQKIGILFVERFHRRVDDLLVGRLVGVGAENEYVEDVRIFLVASRERHRRAADHEGGKRDQGYVPEKFSLLHLTYLL